MDHSDSGGDEGSPASEAEKPARAFPATELGSVLERYIAPRKHTQTPPLRRGGLAHLSHPTCDLDAPDFTLLLGYAWVQLNFPWVRSEFF